MDHGSSSCPQLLAEGGILLLQVVNHIQRRKADSTFRSTLLNTLFRDGYLYFGLVMTLRLVAVFLVSTGLLRFANLTSHHVLVRIWTWITLVCIKSDGFCFVSVSHKRFQ